jgi:hypothetical protein
VPFARPLVLFQNFWRPVTAIRNRHDTGSTTARSVDEVALIRDSISALCACIDRIFANPKFIAPAVRKIRGVTAIPVGGLHRALTLSHALAHCERPDPPR